MARNKLVPALLLIVAGLILYAGWREFWFMTDDAYIAFRDVSNSILGNGYTWNPPPFRPVEGYTSFLWMVILEYVWRIVGIAPPSSANSIAFGFAFLTLCATTYAMLRMRLSRHLESHRNVLIGLLLAGVLANTTFLTWSSSGLETALFNFCFVAWVIVAAMSPTHGNRWRLLLTSLAILTYLARPDGILALLATGLILSINLAADLRQKRWSVACVFSVAPLLVFPIHLLWRRSFYGEWLPNTYYAKHIAAWPASGIRYLAAFILEYGLWLWVIVLAVAVVAGLQRMASSNGSVGKGRGSRVRSFTDAVKGRPTSAIFAAIAAATVLAQVGYYTLVIGGDHFEWRVYSYLIPLIWISFLYLLNTLQRGFKPTVLAMTLLLVLSLPIAWTDHLEAAKITRDSPYDKIQVRAGDKLPAFLRWWTEPYDELRSWLLDRSVSVPRQKHLLFWQRQMLLYPARSLHVPEYAEPNPLAYYTTVGVPGWVLPNVAIIDGYGLNDYIIARHEPAKREHRNMAHDRYPPDQYVASFIPNVKTGGPKQIDFYPRPEQFQLTDDRIRKLESYWTDKIVRKLPMPAIDSVVPMPQD